MPADTDKLVVDVVHRTTGGPDVRTQQEIIRRPGEQVNGYVSCKQCGGLRVAIRSSRDHTARVHAYRTLGYTAAGCAVAAVGAPIVNPHMPTAWLAVSLLLAVVFAVAAVRWTLAAATVPLWAGELPGPHDIRPGQAPRQWGPR